jgi:hypothetical protein
VDSLTPEDGGGRILAAKVRQAAVEAGIGPDSPLAPFVDGLAEAVQAVIETPVEVDLRIRPILAEMKAARADLEKASSRPLLTSDQIKRDLLPVILALMRETRPFIMAGLFLAAFCVGGVLGNWRGGRAAADSYAKLPAEWNITLMTNHDAARWIELIRKNQQKGVFDDCKPVPQPNGGKACSFLLWTDPPPATH